jgi:putative ABC transport system permease protein
LLAESLLLAFCGTAAGLALNIGLTSLLSRVQLPLPIPIQFVIQPDWRLLAYAAAVAVVSSVASGLAPAIRGTRAGIGAALKRDERQVGQSAWTLRNLLVAGQLAASIVLLSAGFLFLRNLAAASGMSPGFDIHRTIWAHMRLVPEQYRDRLKTRSLADATVDRLSALTGVEAAAIARVVPLNGHTVNGLDLSTDLQPTAFHVEFNTNYVGPDYFRAMQIPIVQGRAFLPTDRAGAPRVAILNENLGRKLFGSTPPVGHYVRFGKDVPIEIAGVARNSKYFTLGEENAFALYSPYAQSGGNPVDLHFMLRAKAEPDSLIPGIYALLGQVDPAASVEVKPMSKALGFALLPSRVGAGILGAMGLLGLLLAGVGLYGVLLYSVSRRTREIGLRMALGATFPGILSLVLRQAAALSAAGIGVGLALAVFAVRPLAMFLSPEVRPTDVSNFVVVAVVLGAVSLAAAVSPAMRAVRVDPVEALRHD